MCLVASRWFLTLNSSTAHQNAPPTRSVSLQNPNMEVVMTARTIRQLCFAFTLLFALGSQPQALWAQKTQKLSKNLVKRAEKTVEEIKKTEKQLDKTVKKYNDLLKKKKVKDRQKEFKKLNDELKKTEKHVGDLSKRNAEMQKEATKIFGEWSK